MICLLANGFMPLLARLPGKGTGGISFLTVVVWGGYCAVIIERTNSLVTGIL